MKAHELLSGPEKLTTGFLARDSYNLCVEPTDEDACCWCAIGALIKCYGMYGMPKFNEAMKKLKLAIGFAPAALASVAIWSDTSGYEAVHKALVEADV